MNKLASSYGSRKTVENPKCVDCFSITAVEYTEIYLVKNRQTVYVCSDCNKDRTSEYFCEKCGTSKDLIVTDDDQGWSKEFMCQNCFNHMIDGCCGIVSDSIVDEYDDSKWVHKDGDLHSRPQCFQKSKYSDPSCCGEHIVCRGIWCGGSQYTKGCDHRNHPSYMPSNSDDMRVCKNCYDLEDEDLEYERNQKQRMIE